MIESNLRINISFHKTQDVAFLDREVLITAACLLRETGTHCGR